MNSPAENPMKRQIRVKRQPAQEQPQAEQDKAPPAAAEGETTITIPVSVWEQLQRLASVGMERQQEDVTARAYVQALRKR